MAISKKFIFFTLLFITTIVCGVKFFGYHKSDIMHGLQDFAINMRKIRFSPVLMCLLATATGIPPMLGFAPTVTVIGFIYGFPKACIPATIAALLSASISFGLIRVLKLSNRIKVSDKRQAIQDAITQGGFKMVLLIRICPLPWQLTNLLLPLVPTLSYKSFIIASFIASVRFNMDAWVGSQLATITDPDLPPETHKATLVYMGIGIFILALSGIWMYRLTMQKIKEQQEKLLENEEYQRLLYPEDITNYPATEDNRLNYTVGKTTLSV